MARSALNVAPPAPDPMDRLAADFGVDVQDVRVLASIAGRGGFLSLPKARRDQIAAASRRLWYALGDTTSRVLYDKIKEAVT